MTVILTRPDYQPYFVAYAIAQGQRPEDLPKGVQTNMTFMAWIQAQWEEFGIGPYDSRSDEDRAAFLAWLTDRAQVTS